MFGWFKKRFLAKMNTLAYVANMATYFAVFEQVRAKAAGVSHDSEKEAMKAAAMTNYLFGKAPAEMHIQQLDLDAEHKAAITWLQQDPTFQELVVQSLRVVATADYGSGKGASLLGEDVLSRFGAKYPQAPEPSTYEALVMRAIQSLPIKAQMEICQWSKNQGRREEQSKGKSWDSFRFPR